MKKRLQPKGAPELRHLKDLRPDPENRRRHNPRNIGMVVDALQQVGAARSIVIDEDDVILAGNGVTEAAAEAGITKVRVIEADGETLIAVRRSGLTPEQKRALAIYDNRAAELAAWDVKQLQADLDAGLSLTPWFSDTEQGALFSRAAAADVLDLAEGDTGGATGTGGESDYQTLTCPVTIDQERIIRAAIRKAKAMFDVESTGAALARALEQWMADAEDPPEIAG